MTIAGKYITQNNVDNWRNDITQTEMQEIIDSVEQVVERVTGDFFYVKTFHKFFDGNGNNQLFPKFKSKILSINKLTIFEVDVSTIDFTSTSSAGTSGTCTLTLTKASVIADFYENDYIGIYDVSESVETASTASGNMYWGSRILSNTATSSGVSDFTVENPLPMTVSSGDVVSIISNWDWDENSIYRNKPVSISEPNVLNEPSSFFWDERFPRGKKGIEVWGTYGWRNCPKQVKEACIILARYENNDTLYSAYGYGMKSEKLGDYSYTRFDNSQSGGKTLTGVSEADRKLKLYLKRKPILGVV